MIYIAHVRESDGQLQTVEEHLRGVQRLAEKYGAKIGIRHLAGLAGLLHDFGKYATEFQNYIREAVEHPDAPPRRGSVDHSTAGAKLLYALYHIGKPARLEWLTAEIVGNAILSHHSYLHDYLDPDLESPYLNRVRDKDVPEFDVCKQLFFDRVMGEAELHEYVKRAQAELDAFIARPYPGNDGSRLMFLTKFVFSSLIDADRTNTRLFEQNQAEEPDENRALLFAAYYERLLAEIERYRQRDTTGNAINALRRRMSDRCDEYAEQPSGIYSLSIPTGGGKTLASLRYALRHAQLRGKRQIIYVVPYTTIIEQNAEEVRRVLQAGDRLLEHHSNVIDDVNDEDEHEDGRMTANQKLKLARDNWDSPLIFTTMVQFLNVFFAKGSRNIRRLHSLSEAVVIFDEVQKVPVPCVSLFNQALNFLKSFGNSGLVLCTATQPALDFVEHKLEIGTDAEIIPDMRAVQEAFKRVEVMDWATEESFDSDRLAAEVREHSAANSSVLVILNTKAAVKRLYQLLKSGETPVYHLSTSMCAAHRQEILGKVRAHLDKEEKVICVSTALIEAGVDVSFACVIRSLAGLDSIAQAAGRCNRHGKLAIKQVYVIDHAEENLQHLPEIRKGKEIARKILIDLRYNPDAYEGGILGEAAMERYFREFYTEFASSLNYPVKPLKKDLVELLTAHRKASSYNLQYESEHGGAKLQLFIVNSYRTAAEHFQVIDSPTIPVIVPYGRGKDIIVQLNGNEKLDDLGRLLREAQQYSVNLFRHERERLAQNDALVSLLDGQALALKESAYDGEFGVDPGNDGGFAFGMI